jgi:peroxiredoxin
MNRSRRLALAMASVLITMVSCAEKSPSLKTGIWRSTLDRADGRQIAFNFEVKDSAGKKVIYIINGEERLLVDSIRINGDSVLINMPFFESGFRAKLNDKNNLEGVFFKRLADKDQIVPFHAVYNEKERFPITSKPTGSINGRWAVEFRDSKNNIENSVGEFHQKGNHVKGTFLNTSGDYRYLDGVVNGDSVQLSAFDGGHAYLFTAKISGDSITGGKFYSGPVASEQWVAKKDDKAALPDAFEETKMKPGQQSLDFSFKSIDGKTVSINDPEYKNKVVIIQIMGSWCPNCMDETKFLSDYYSRNKDKGVEMVGLAYERSTDFERSAKALQSFRNRFNVQYPILVTGVTVSDSLRSEKTLPQIEKINAFPTTIFIDRKGVVRKIHTGFTGPGTGEHYDEFKKEFDELVTGLLNEK